MDWIDLQYYLNRFNMDTQKNVSDARLNYDVTVSVCCVTVEILIDYYYDNSYHTMCGGNATMMRFYNVMGEM